MHEDGVITSEVSCGKNTSPNKQHTYKEELKDYLK